MNFCMDILQNCIPNRAASVVIDITHLQNLTTHSKNSQLSLIVKYKTTRKTHGLRPVLIWSLSTLSLTLLQQIVISDSLSSLLFLFLRICSFPSFICTFSKELLLMCAYSKFLHQSISNFLDLRETVEKLPIMIEKGTPP